MNERAIATWLALKDVLRTKLSIEEWELWVFPARLLAVSPADPRMAGCALDTLVIALPRNGRAAWKAQARKDLVRSICLRANYHIFFTMAPADYEQERIVERFGRPFEFLDPEPQIPFRRISVGGIITQQRSIPPTFFESGGPMAKELSHKEYLTLRNTARVLREAKELLTPEQRRRVEQYEAAVAEYERTHQEANG